MERIIKTMEFKRLPIEIEVKDLRFAHELPKLLGQPHRANFYQVVWITEGVAHFRIDFREVTIHTHQILIIVAGQVCQFDVTSRYSGKLILFTSSFFAMTELDANFLYTSEILNPVSLNQSVSVCPQLIANLVSLLDEELKLHSDDYQSAIAQSHLRVVLLEADRQLTKSTLRHPAA